LRGDPLEAPEARSGGRRGVETDRRDLLEMKLIDGVIPEPLGGAHRNHAAAIANLKSAVSRQLDELRAIPVQELLEQRYAKFRRVGEFVEEA